MDAFVPAPGRKRSVGKLARIAVASQSAAEDKLTVARSRRAKGKSTVSESRASVGAPAGRNLTNQSPQCRITRHTMQSNFRVISLKTNDGCTEEVTHFLNSGLPVSTANRAWEIKRCPAFLIDTRAIRNTLNSNQSSAESLSNRHISRVPITVKFAAFAQVYSPEAPAIPVISVMMGRAK